jgi:hypothetical protein
MAVAAVAETFDQMAATIPSSGLRDVRNEGALGEIKLTPRGHRPALVEREIEVVDVTALRTGRRN